MIIINVASLIELLLLRSYQWVVIDSEIGSEAAVSSTTGTSSGGGVYVVVYGFTPPMSVHPAPRIARIRIAVVMMMVLLDCIKIELW